MKRIMLIVAYDGTNYHGWQIQPKEISVEEVLNKALCSLLKEEISVIGASRTDAGVHALGNVAVFDTETKIAPDKIAYALNQRLPEDIRIMRSLEVNADFHPRKIKGKKTYEYRIDHGRIYNPIRRLYASHVYYRLDLEKMQQAAAFLIGEHNFKSFAAVNTQVQDTVRTIYSLEIVEKENEIRIRVCGNGFLYNMVRIIAGTLIEVGRGMINPEELPAILEKCNREASGPTAPARGLTLVEIAYDEDITSKVMIQE